MFLISILIVTLGILTAFYNTQRSPIDFKYIAKHSRKQFSFQKIFREQHMMGKKFVM